MEGYYILYVFAVLCFVGGLIGGYVIGKKENDGK